MPNLIIKKKIDSITFGTWKWSEDDYERPLSFQLDGARSQIFIEQDKWLKPRDLNITFNLNFVLII